MKDKSYSLFLFLLLFLCPFVGLSTTYYSRVSGNWNTASTWSTVSCSGTASAAVPGAGDNVIICAGKTVTMNGNPGACLSLTINGTASWSSAYTTNVGAGGVTMAGGTFTSGALVTGKIVDAGPFNVTAGTSTFARGTITVAGTTTISGTLNWTSTRGKKTFGNLVIASGGVFNNSANEKFSVQGNFQNDGTFTGGTGAALYTLTGAAKTITGASATTIDKLTVTGSYTNNNILTVSTTLSGAGTFTQGSSGTLNISAGTFSVTTFNASAAGNIVNYSMTGNFNVRVPNDGSYSNLRVSSGSTKKLLANTIVGASLLIATSTVLNANNFNLTVGGNFTNNNSFTEGTATVTLNGTASQTISGTAITTFNNLTISNSAGIQLGINAVVNGVLHFTAGVITTAVNKITMGTAGSVTGAGTSKFVNGFLEKNVSTGAGVARTFETGFGTTDYLPVTMTFANVTTAGKITAKANNGDHPNIGTCCIDNAKSVNRYWQLTNAGVAFTTYSVVCTFIGVPADADAGSVPANYVMSVFNSGVWTLLTPGTRTATSTQSTSVSIIGDLQIGEKRVPAITAQPVNTTVCNNTLATFSITATGAISYQWQQNAGAGFVNLANGGIYSGVTTATLSMSAVTNAMNTYQYRCVINSNCGTSSITSTAAILTVTPNVTASITISASPSTTICSGTMVTFTAVPVNGGTTPAYQWKVNGANVGTNAPTYSSSALTNGNLVTCVLTSNATCVLSSPATSNTITMTVNPSVAASVSISASPSATVCAGTSVTFTAVPTNGGTTPTYQWKKNGTNIAGATSSTFTSSTLVTGDAITCVMTSNAPCATGSPATSNVITMTVNPILPASVNITASPSSTICAGTSVTFTAVPTNGGTTPTYQWKKNGTNIAGATSSTFTSNTLTNGNIITCVMTSNATCVSGSPATSNSITMTVNASLPVSVSIGATSTSICAGTNVTFTATPTNGGATPAYQWKINGGNVGVSSTSFSSTTLNNGDLVTCVLTSSAACATGSPATSSTITMTVNPNLPASVSISATATTICPLTSVTFTATPTNGGTPTYQWKKNGTNIIGATSATYTSATLTNGNVITCVMTSTALCATGSPATSNPITIIVNATLPVSVAIAASPSSTICSGSPVTFTATPVNGGTSPSYQWKLNGGNVGTNSSTYSNSALTNGNIITCILTAGGITCGTGSPATSNTITMTVNPNLPVSVSASPSPVGTICSGTNVTFTATPTNGGAGPIYQWKLNGGNVGTSSTTYSNSALANGDVITCVLTSNATCPTGNPATSAGTTMSVNPSLPVSVSVTPSPAGAVCSGTNVTFTAAPTNGGTTPAYQWKRNGGNVGTNSTTYSNSALANGDVITCVLTSNATCPTGNPATAVGTTMTVNPNLPVSVSVAASPAGAICSGTNVTFTATPTNGGTTPAYQWKLNGTNVGTNSTTYSNSALVNGDVVTCVLTSNATCATGNPATAIPVTMSVSPNLTVSVSIASAPVSPICSGTNVTFTATPTNGGTTPSYQWKLNGTNTGTNSATYSNSTLATGDAVTCVLTSNATCVISPVATSNTLSFIVTVSGTWLGTASSDWSSGANWCGGVPVTTTNVIVPAGTPFSPQLTGSSTCKNMIINAGATFNLGSSTINIKGDWVNNGTFNQGTGTLVFDGTSAQNITTANPVSFNNLTINNSAGVNLASGVFSLDGLLTLTNGHFNTLGNTFTMTSTPSRTARIAPILGNGSAIGDFTVQRYITARDTTYCDLASPVQNSTFMDWGAELPAISYTSSGSYERPSAYTYNETADMYVPVTSSATVLVPGEGFEVFLSGGFSYSSFPATTMNTIGNPSQGNQDLSGLISNNVQGWNLVGNPFASSISWATIYTASGGAASGLYDYIEMYDYTIQDWNGYTSADGIEVGSSQGFWVYGLPGASSLTLIVPEISKTTSSNSSVKSLTRIPYFTLKMSGTTAENAFSHTFKIAANAVSSDGLDKNDLPFRYSPNKGTPALYSMIEGKKLNVNSFNSNNDSYSMQLKTEVGVNGNYQIEAAGFDYMNDYSCIELEDKVLNKTIDLTHKNVYSFSMQKTDGPDRFIIHFNKNKDCPASLASSEIAGDFENEVNVLPTERGNVINFNLGENTPVVIEVTDLLGQRLVATENIVAYDQSEKITLPVNYSGMYLIKISSEKGTIVKKFYR